MMPCPYDNKDRIGDITFCDVACLNAWCEENGLCYTSYPELYTTKELLDMLCVSNRKCEYEGYTFKQIADKYLYGTDLE